MKAINSENVNQELTYFENQASSSRITATPLHLAVKGGHVRVVKYLIQVGADVDKKDSLDRTPLDVAMKNGVSLLHVKSIGSAAFRKGRQNMRFQVTFGGEHCMQGYIKI